MSESDGEEQLCYYGTPLEAIDEESVAKRKPIGVENQVATDEHGRRRFHGAFTGGFSAGYFNTVGTMEGWLPNQFKSSRSKKSGKFEQKLEDFMDSEDMGEFGFAPKVIRTTDEFGSSSANDGGNSGSGHGHGHEKRKRKMHSTGPIPGDPVLSEMLRSVKDTVGVRLLKKMGWKPGQGVGPRITKLEKQKLRREKTKVYGCELPKELQKGSTSGDAVSDSDSDSDYESVTFAPDDYEPNICNPKTNRWGIGYSGLEKSVLNLFGSSVSTLALTEKKGKKLSITGQAFGVGAFEDEDEDIYGQHDMSSYDFVLETEADKKSKRKPADNELLELGALEGFQKGQTQLLLLKHFLVPTLPNNYVPRFSSRKSKFEPLPESHPLHNYDRTKTNTQPKLCVDLRAKLLKEAEVVSSDGRQSAECTPKPGGSTEIEKGPIGDVSKVFAADPEKQKRYELWFKAPNRKTFCLEAYQPFGMTRQERQQEREEFEEAERQQHNRPKSDMEKRFVSAQSRDASSSSAHLSKNAIVDEMRQAVQAKMFGSLTRQLYDWIPDPLLSKRFNIPELRRSITSSHKSGSKKPLAIFDFVDFVEEKDKSVDEVRVERSSEHKNEILLEPKYSSQNNRTESASTNTAHKVVISSKNDSDRHMEGNRSLNASDIVDDMIDRKANLDLYNLIFNEESNGEDDDDGDDRDRDQELDLGRHDSGRIWSEKGFQTLTKTMGKETKVNIGPGQKEDVIEESIAVTAIVAETESEAVTREGNQAVYENKQIENFKKILLNESYNNRKLEISQSSLPISSKKGILSNLDMAQINSSDDVRTTTGDNSRIVSEQTDRVVESDHESVTGERKKPKKHKKHKKSKKLKKSTKKSKKVKKSKQLNDLNDDSKKLKKKKKKVKEKGQRK